MPEITRELLAEALEEIAVLLELKGENPFKIRAYRNGAEITRSFDGDILQRAKDDDLSGIKGIGEALQQKLHELATTGMLAFHQDLKAEFPEGLFELLELQGLGPKKVKVLYDELSIATLGGLKRACEAGEVGTLTGFGKKSEEKILAAIEAYNRFSGRFLLAEVAPDAQRILGLLQQHPDVNRAAIAGSYRRGKETVHDLDFLVATGQPSALTAYFTGLKGIQEVLAEGATKASVRLESGLQCDLRAISNSEWPFALMYFTGSKEHNVELRSRALKQNLTLNEYHLQSVEDAPDGDPPADLREEADVYAELGLQFIEPSLRENRGEFEAAEEGTLPRLVEQDNLRGTFHNHTTESDGRSTLTEMAEAARNLGLAYLGISDHSKSSFQANGLDEGRLLTQIAAIRELDTELDDLDLYAGNEVDILRDGSLDFEDEVLAKLDYVVASVHASFGLTESEMTARIIKAMENPHVTMLGHLSGRLLLRREPYSVNHGKIIDCAAETRTVIELNCAAQRMDMDWKWWRRARDKGVKCAINPDAHHVDGLQNLHFGIRIARKGWLRREDVLNCLSAGDMKSWLGTPKDQRP